MIDQPLLSLQRQSFPATSSSSQIDSRSELPSSIEKQHARHIALDLVRGLIIVLMVSYFSLFVLQSRAKAVMVLKAAFIINRNLNILRNGAKCYDIEIVKSFY